jgi:hypothetical protein
VLRVRTAYEVPIATTVAVAAQVRGAAQPWMLALAMGNQRRL